ncbi:hypothetical protein N431DRAFT_491272 [Stipitochalara longipes BDJ]|nr:hypothetical protein N431DRAFT_491272 [Stipitochalara longipes BDJ]
MPAPRVLQEVARASLPPPHIQARAAEAASSPSTGSLLREQWTNPSDVLSVLMIIGGDIVQKALAETSGGLFTPVCFSFGWVAYSFTALVNLLGDGRLLPEPDHPVKVFNLGNGYVRENKHWVIGRIGRDHEMLMTREHPLEGNALRISVFEAAKCRTGTAVAGSGMVRLFSVVAMVLQFGVAAIPVAVWDEWGVMMVTAAGTLGALAAGALPQWRAEKMPSRTDSRKNFAISSGNGSRDIMIILGRGNCLDLEELAFQESPRSTKIWEKIDFLSNQVYDENGKEKRHSNNVRIRTSKMMFGIPLGFIMTGALCTIQSVFWIALLITVAGLKSHSWFILAVGALGMFQNAAVAAIGRDPSKRNLPLISVDQIISRKVMDGLMDLEITFPGHAPFLIEEFFPGELTDDEVEWWKGKRDRYDDRRCNEKDRRGIPRSRLPKYQNSNNFETDKGYREDDHDSDGPLLEPVLSTSPKSSTRSQPKSIIVPKVTTPQPLLAAPQETAITIPRTPRPPEDSTSNFPEKSHAPTPPTDSPVSPRHRRSTSTTASSPTAMREKPDLPPPELATAKPPSPKKAKGPVTFAETTETHDFAPKAPARAMTQPETPTPKEEHRPSASLSVDEIYKITHSPDWS